MQTSYRKILLTSISENLIKIREKNNYTQAEVAEGIGVSLRTYQVYESDKIYDIRISNMVKIANFYNVKIDTLIR